jgi:hypothetical protein
MIYTLAMNVMYSIRLPLICMHISQCAFTPEMQLCHANRCLFTHKHTRLQVALERLEIVLRTEQDIPSTRPKNSMQLYEIDANDPAVQVLQNILSVLKQSST